MKDTAHAVREDGWNPRKNFAYSPWYPSPPPANGKPFSSFCHNLDLS